MRKWEKYVLKKPMASPNAGTARSEAFCYENEWDVFCLAGMSGNLIH